MFYMLNNNYPIATVMVASIAAMMSRCHECANFEILPYIIAHKR